MIKPNDHEALFNMGNTLYRHARLKEQEKQYRRAFELMDMSCATFLGVLELNCANAGAMHNWGMVLQAECKYI